MKNKQNFVAVQQHFLSHYRERIFSLMSSQESPLPHYTFFSDTTSAEGIVTIEKKILVSDVVNGKGIRWKPVTNVMIGKVILFQTKIIGIAFLRKYDCIIYLGCMYHVTTWISALLAKLFGKRVLMWTHGYLKEEKGFKGYVREIFYRLADGLLLYGNRGRSLLINRGFHPDKLYVVYNSLNYDLQKSIRKIWDVPRLKTLRCEHFSSPDLPVLVFTGRLTKQKRLDLIFSAQMKLQTMGVMVNVLILGDGPDKQNLMNFVDSSNLTAYVKFFGACYDENIIGPLLMMSDICVSPGEVGLTCIHSLAYGTPVITHDDPERQVPEWEAIVPGLTGALFAIGDFNALAHSILDWLNNGLTREVVASNCICTIEKFYTPESQLSVINRAVAGLPAENTSSALSL